MPLEFGVCCLPKEGLQVILVKSIERMKRYKMVVVKLAVVLLLMVVLLRLKIKIGTAVMISSLSLWLLSGFHLDVLIESVSKTLQNPQGWIIVGALYFIMWLEYLLRTRGVMDSFLVTIQLLVPNRKAVMMIIAAFLGLLPSMGGAIFSAPMVKKLGSPLKMSKNDQNLVNFWSRHLCDYGNPISPAILLICATVHVALQDLLVALIGYGILATGIGWFFLFRGVPDAPPEPVELPMSAKKTLALALGPIALIFIFIIFFGLNAAAATFLSTGILTLILWRDWADFKEQVVDSFNVQIFWTVGAVLFFQNMLGGAGMIDGLIGFFQDAGLSPVVGISIMAFIIGGLVGMLQGMVAIVFPFVAGIGMGDLSLAVLIYIIGTSGQMLTPTHLCLSLSTAYFQADWGKLYRKLIPMQLTLLVVAVVVYWLQN